MQRTRRSRCGWQFTLRGAGPLIWSVSRFWPMKTKMLPIIWYVTAVGAFFAVLVAGRRLLAPKLIAVIVAWPVSIIAALLLGSLAVKLRPDLRFSTKQQVDGLGYVHQPMDVVVYMTLLFVCLAIVAILKR